MSYKIIPYFRICYRLSVNITHNINIGNGIANGTNRKIVGVEYSEDIELETIASQFSKRFIAIELPCAVFVDIPGGGGFQWNGLA